MIDYANKVILAPMVRVGTLPMRLLSLQYGADLVYCQEIIDHRILACTRIENKLLQTVDYVAPDGVVIFRTCDTEKRKLVFQMGTCDPERALKAARMLQNDISGLDINMGCPKEFSIQGGMGAALLTQPEKVEQILTTLVSGLSIPVTCKIRILPELSDTLALAKVIEGTGVKALGVHGRVKEERSRCPCHDDVIAKISEFVSIPVIANGGSLVIKKYEDIEKFKQSTACSSVMLARAAQWDPSVFRAEGCLPLMDVMKEYVKIAVKYDSVKENVKYVLCKMIGDTTKEEAYKQIHAARDVQDICIALDLEDYRQNILGERDIRKKLLEDKDDDEIEPKAKRFKKGDTVMMDVIYNRKIYPHTVSPLQILSDYCKRNNLEQPIMDTNEDSERTFKCILEVDGILYTSKNRERRKKSSEQASAMVFLKHHGIHDGSVIR